MTLVYLYCRRGTTTTDKPLSTLTGSAGGALESKLTKTG